LERRVHRLRAALVIVIVIVIVIAMGVRRAS
jgi:hypothetical protein